MLKELPDQRFGASGRSMILGMPEQIHSWHEPLSSYAIRIMLSLPCAVFRSEPVAEA